MALNNTLSLSKRKGTHDVLITTTFAHLRALAKSKTDYLDIIQVANLMAVNIHPRAKDIMLTCLRTVIRFSTVQLKVSPKKKENSSTKRTKSEIIKHQVITETVKARDKISLITNRGKWLT